MKKNILMIIPSFLPLIGGAEKQLLNLSMNLVRSNVSIEVVTRLLPGTKTEEHIHGFTIRRLKNYFPNIGFLISLFIFILKNKSSYDLFHIHTLNSPAILGSFLGQLLNIPVLLKVTRSGHGAQLESIENSFLKKLLFHKIKKYSNFVAITRDVHNELSLFGVEKNKIFNIPNGVDVEEKLFKDPNTHLNNNIVKIAYVGRLIKRKRVDWLIKALSEISDKNKFELIIIGDGPEKSALKSLAASLLATEQFHFTGSIEHADAIRKLNDCEIFALPSDSEGMSNALLEAMASGLAVVAAKIPSNKELVEHEHNGLLFSNFEELKNNLESLLSDKNLTEILSENAHSSIYENFSFERISKSYLRLYTDIIQQTRS